MKLPRRQFLHLAVGAAALSAVSHFAWAQAYPSRPVRIIAPTGPAGAPDILARLIAPWLSERGMPADGISLPPKKDFGTSRWGGSKVRLHQRHRAEEGMTARGTSRTSGNVTCVRKAGQSCPELAGAMQFGSFSYCNPNRLLTQE
jgi:hypothetical protein